MISSGTNVPLKVAKCTCGAGDTRTLNMLRATTLADLNVDEYNEIVGAVNKAGGIAKTVGIWRLLIAKAAEQYTLGVLKGDYVGHPFRGNQHSDSSGASRGGAGGTPSKRKVNATALRQFDRVMAENRKGTKASQDKQRAAALDSATGMAMSMLERTCEENEDRLLSDEQGVGQMSRRASDDANRANRELEMLQNYSETSKADIKAAKIKEQSANNLSEALAETQKDIKEANDALKTAKDKAAKSFDATKLSFGVRRAIGILVRREGILRAEGDAERAASKVGRGNSGTAMQYGFPVSALQDRIKDLQELDEDSRSFKSQVDDLMQDPDFVADFSD